MPQIAAKKTRSQDRLAIWIPPIGLAILAVGLCDWLWGRTGDILIDFGNELYVAWQLCQGHILYRDVAYVYGPISPYFNAMLMRIFSPRGDVILSANLVILIVVSTLLYFILRAFSGTLAAFLATAFFLFYFAASCPTRIANYNFLTPYAHPMTHGFALCLGVILCLMRFQKKESAAPIIAAGLLTGLAFLTKPEIFLACATIFILGLAASIRLRKPRHLNWIISSAFASIFFPPICALILLAMAMPFADAFRGILGGWQFVNAPFVIATPFYKESLGTDNIRHSLFELFHFSAIYSIVLLCIAALAMMGGRLRAPYPVKIAFGICIGIGGYYLTTHAGDNNASFWTNADRGLSIVAMSAVIWTGIKILRRKIGDDQGRRILAQFSFAVLSLTLLAKIFLNARTYQFGFVLAAPCGMLVAIGLIDWLTSAIHRAGGSAVVARFAAIGLLTGLAANRLILTNQILWERSETIPLALGGSLQMRPIDSASIDAIRWLSHTPGSAAILPDFTGIDFAAGRKSDVKYNVLNAMTFAMYTEPAVVRSFQTHPPDYILILQANERAFGADFFGRDYGAQLFQWIQSHYHRVKTLQGPRNPVEAWERD